MSHHQFQDQFPTRLRERADRLTVRVPVNLGAIMAEGRAAQRIRRLWIVAGGLVVALALAVATLLGLHVFRAVAPQPGPTPTMNWANTPTPTPTRTPSPTEATPSILPLLTPAQFADLTSVQLPARGFPEPDPTAPANVSEIAGASLVGQCGATRDLGANDLVAAAEYGNALGAPGPIVLTTVALFDTADAAIRLMGQAAGCAAENGIAASLASRHVGGVTTLAATWSSGDGGATYFAQYGNVLVITYFPDATMWTDFVANAFPGAVDAASLTTGDTATQSPPSQPILTQTQFDDLVVKQLPARGIPAPTSYDPHALALARFIFSAGPFLARMCPVFESLGANEMTTQAIVDLDSARLTMARFPSEHAAAVVAEQARTCVTEDGGVILDAGAFATGAVSRTDVLFEDADGVRYNLQFAVYGNVMVYTYQPEAMDWETFVATILPQAVDAAFAGGAEAPAVETSSPPESTVRPVDPAPGTGALTRAQFTNLLDAQLPARGFPAAVGVEWTRMTEIGGHCQAYASLGADNVIVGTTFPGALRDGLSSGAPRKASVSVALFTTGEYALRAMSLATTCGTELGVVRPTAQTDRVGGVDTLVATWPRPQGGVPDKNYIAVYRNVLVWSYYPLPEDWDAFVATTFPQAVDAAILAAGTGTTAHLTVSVYALDYDGKRIVDGSGRPANATVAAKVGDVVRYQVAVFNDGSQALTGIAVTNDRSTGFTGTGKLGLEAGNPCQVEEAIRGDKTPLAGAPTGVALGIGETLRCWETYTVTAADAARAPGPDGTIRLANAAVATVGDQTWTSNTVTVPLG